MKPSKRQNSERALYVYDFCTRQPLLCLFAVTDRESFTSTLRSHRATVPGGELKIAISTRASDDIADTLRATFAKNMVTDTIVRGVPAREVISGIITALSDRGARFHFLPDPSEDGRDSSDDSSTDNSDGESATGTDSGEDSREDPTDDSSSSDSD